MDYSKCTLVELKQMLQVRGIKTSGNKAELVARLQQFDMDNPNYVEFLSGSEEPLIGFEEGVSPQRMDQIDVLQKGISGLLDAVAALTRKVESLEKNNTQTNVQQTESQFSAASCAVVCSSAVTNTTTTTTNSLPISVSQSITSVPVNVCVTSTSNVNERAANMFNHDQYTLDSNIDSGDARRTGNVFSPYSGIDNHRLSNNSHSQRQNEEIVSNYSVNEICRMLPEFDPCHGEMSSVKFIERIDQLRQAYRWNDSVLLFAVQSNLKGVAKMWVDSQPVHRNWSQFVNAFLLDFPCVNNSADTHIEMMNSRMNKNESVLEFYYRMLSTGRRGNIDDNAIIKYVVNGINDEHLRRTLITMNFISCTDLFKTLKKISEEDKMRKMYSEQYRKTNNNPNVNKDKLNFVNSSENNEGVKKGPTCFNCRERGHIARNCKNKNKNEEKNKEKDKCPSRSVNLIDKNNVKPTNKEIFKEVEINNEKFCAFIDSGSGKSLVARRVLSKCDASTIKCKELLYGFAGGQYVCYEKLLANIKIDGISADVELLIVDDDVMQYEVIIGRDILSKNRVIMENGQCRVVALNGENLDVNNSLNENEKCQLQMLLEKYSKCFAENIKDIGKCDIIEMNIKVNSSKPIARNPYNIPIPKQKTVEKIIKELLETEIIRPSKSLYSSPIVIVPKQNGEDRMCVDYRELNSITEKQPWPMPTVDGVLQTLAGKKYFTILDMMSGYYQIPISEESKQYTAFVTHHGHFEYNRMPFGLKNAPSMFQQMMAKVLEPIKDDVVSYVDEVIVASNSVSEGLSKLETLLKVVQSNGLTLRMSKCSFLKNNVTFLGHELNENGIMPGKVKTLAVKNFPVPTNVAEVRRFIGLTGYFRKFIPNYALIAAPLTRLTRKNVEFVWNSECEESYRKLIQLLQSEPVLDIYDVKKQHELHTDACSTGLAGILLQRDDANNLRPIAYFSRLCNDAERNYHSYEHEVLAVVESCQRFRMYLLGKQFLIVTDCSAISSLKLSKPVIPRVSRWYLKLMEYDYTIVHREGSKMCHVDALSRSPIENHNNETAIQDVTDHVMMIKPTINDWVYMMQCEDRNLKEIIDVLLGRKQSTQRKQYIQEFVIKDNRLFRKGDENSMQLVVPMGLRWRVVKSIHDDVGHPAIENTLKRLLRYFWFPRARNFVKNYIKACVECCFCKEPIRKECELYGMEIPNIPFEVMHMDHLGPFVRSRNGNEHLLVMVDALTRYVVLYPVKSTKTKPVLDSLNQLTTYFGMPKVLVTDRGTAFTSGPFEKYCSENSIQHIKIAVRTPRANGLAERINKSILSYLKSTVNDAKDWDAEIRCLQWTLNTNVNSTTKYAPIDLVLDFPVRDIIGNKMLAVVQDANCNAENLMMNKKREDAIKNIEDARKLWKARFDSKHKTPHKFKEDDLILLECAIPSTGESRKLEVEYRGPYVVKKVLRYDRYLVEDVNDAQRNQRKFSTVASSDKMKPWCALYPNIDEAYDDDPNSSSEDA